MSCDGIINIIKVLYLHFEQCILDYKFESRLLDICSFVTIIMTGVLFIFLKKKLRRKEDILGLYSKYSLTEEEKKIAYILFQIIIVCVIINILIMPIMLMVICKMGIESLPKLVCNVLFISINMFLILELVRRIFILIEKIFDSKNVGYIIRTCIFLASIMICYHFRGLIMQKYTMLKNYNSIWTKVVEIFAYIMDKTHFIISFYLSLVLSIALIGILYFLPDSIDRDKKIYMNIRYNIENMVIIQRLVKYNTMLYSYIVNISRRIDSMGMFIVTIFAYIMAIIIRVSNPIFVTLLLTITSLYTYVQTEAIRRIQYIRKYSALRDYIYMIISQIIYFVIASSPFSIISIMRGDSIVCIMSFYFWAVILINLFTFIGISFVQKKNNSVMVIRGGLVTFVSGGIILMRINTIYKNEYYRIIALIFIMICLIVYSISVLDKREYTNKMIGGK